MNPDTGAFEPAAGRTQFCRVRDDFGNWFGNDNSSPLWHYPLDERYVRRNPHVTYPGPKVAVAADKDPGRLYPISPLLERFNNPESANRVTSACGPTIYRDNDGRWSNDEPADALNAFFCEPVHNMVRRLVLTPRGATFEGHRSPKDEREFLASTDNWFRPVQTRTGPDGALYVVDMYRFVIEHPRWITKERMATLDTRAGAEMGRIYRIVPPGREARPIEDLSKLTTAELAGRLGSPNGIVRDLVHRELVHRQDVGVLETLEGIAGATKPAAARVQAAGALEGLGLASAALVRSHLSDADPRVRRNAVRLAEGWLAKDPAVAEAVLERAGDDDAAVRYQVALSLGEWDDPRVPAALAEIARASAGDVWTRAAVLTAAARRPVELLDAIAKDGEAARPLRTALAATVAATGDAEAVGRVLVATLPGKPDSIGDWHFAVATSVLEALDRRHRSVTELAPDAAARLELLLKRARVVARGTDGAKPAARIAALRLLGRDPAAGEMDVRIASEVLAPVEPPAVQAAAVAALARSQRPTAAAALVAALPRVSPVLRTQILDAVTARPKSVGALFAAIEGGKLTPAELPAATREKLLHHADAAIQERARHALATARPAARVAALEAFRPALGLKGDVAKGRALFEKSCAACHRLADVGVAVGPDLSALTDKSAGYLLTAIVDPNAAVEGRFAAYQLETTEGDTLVGLLADENAAGVTLLQASGVRQTLARAEIKSLAASKVSLMPEGLEQGMTPQDLADLIAFVQKPTNR
jgi:putative heme-binding domain-containing protein